MNLNRLYYTLKGKEIIPETDVLTWAIWFEKADRTVAKTQVNDVEVSTVFLGLDHNYTDDGPPILFETIVFGGELDEEQHRYATWGEAEKGHEYVVKLVKLAEGIK